MQAHTGTRRGGIVSVVNGVVTDGARPLPLPFRHRQVEYNCVPWKVSLARCPTGTTNQDMTYDPSGVFTFRSVVPGKYMITAVPLTRMRTLLM